MPLSKTLPADIEQIIATGDIEAVARAVERCEVGPYLRGSAYESRLMHFPASEEITDLLLARGEDIKLARSVRRHPDPRARSFAMPRPDPVADLSRRRHQCARYLRPDGVV